MERDNRIIALDAIKTTMVVLRQVNIEVSRGQIRSKLLNSDGIAKPFISETIIGRNIFSKPFASA